MHKITKREQAVIDNLKRHENDEHLYMAKVQEQHENNIGDVHISRALDLQINRWSVSYQVLHETIDIIES